ncbi:hypothetical protein GCM10022237_36540 [Nocardioides ginsengisoli]|uniref:Nucleotidyltransferase family protein n=1 Tax=Nocardioides ginsengisoli TaxID=363868 RepID=A0ABW3VVB6_9ACTN
MTAESEASPTLPMAVRLEFVHCLVQRAADAAQVRVLHIKGVLAARQLGLVGRRPVDVDVWSSPGEVGRLIRELERAGWVADEISSSARRYRHAAVLTHPAWGCSVDVHHRFPGIGLEPAPAFEELWAQREEQDVAGWRLAVPATGAHALVVLLHAARGMGSLRARDDVDQLCGLLEQREIRAVADWATRLECPPEAAAMATSWLRAVPPPVGVADGAGVRLWLGRIGAARGLRHRAALLRAAVLPDRAVMSARARGPLAGGALVRAWSVRWLVGLRDLTRLLARPAVRATAPHLPDATSAAAVMPVRDAAPAPVRAAPATDGAARIAVRRDGDDLWVARLDTGVVRLLNATAALVWEAARPADSGPPPADDVVVAVLATLLGAADDEVAPSVRGALAALRDAGLLEDEPVTNGSAAGPP